MQRENKSYLTNKPTNISLEDEEALLKAEEDAYYEDSLALAYRKRVLEKKRVTFELKKIQQAKVELSEKIKELELEESNLLQSLENYADLDSDDIADKEDDDIDTENDYEGGVDFSNTNPVPDDSDSVSSDNLSNVQLDYIEDTVSEDLEADLPVESEQITESVSETTIVDIIPKSTNSDEHLPDGAELQWSGGKTNGISAIWHKDGTVSFNYYGKEYSHIAVSRAAFILYKGRDKEKNENGMDCHWQCWYYGQDNLKTRKEQFPDFCKPLEKHIVKTTKGITSYEDFDSSVGDVEANLDIQRDNIINDKSDRLFGCHLYCDGVPFDVYLVGKQVLSIAKGKYRGIYKNGAYVLFNNKDQNACYVGQATGKEGIIGRLLSHRPNQQKPFEDVWDFAICVTLRTEADGFTMDEAISLENRLNKRVIDLDLTSWNTAPTHEGVRVDSDLIDQAVEFLVACLRYLNIDMLGKSYYSRYLDNTLQTVYKPDLVNLKGEDELDDIRTPVWAVKQMVDLIPEEKFVPESKFVDLSAKDGGFLVELKDRLMKADAMVKAFKDRSEREQYIRDNMLFGVCMSTNGYTLTFENLEFGDKANIVFGSKHKDWNSAVRSMPMYKESIVSGEAYYCDETGTLHKAPTCAVLSWLFSKGEDFNMKFDVVIGNPPYNNDLYLDFVQTGYNLLKDDGVMVQITPAKWQAKGGKKNEDFRANIVPHMKEIVYYPEETDIFDIRSACGICFYSITKQIYPCKNITNICLRSPMLNTKPVFREYKALNTLYNVGISIIAKVQPSGYDILSNDTTKRYRVALNNQVLYWGSSQTKSFFSPEGKSQVLSVCKVFDSTFEKLEVGAAKYVYSTNDNSEIPYFVSWIDTKLIRFLVLIGFNVLTGVLNKEFWRFVPNPGKFDHIFTDDELYKKYNLTQDEINIIESVIKERK